MFGSRAPLADFNHTSLSINQAHQVGECPPFNLSLTWVSRERQPTDHGLEPFSLRTVIIIIAIGCLTKTLLVVSIHCYLLAELL